MPSHLRHRARIVATVNTLAALAFAACHSQGNAPSDTGALHIPAPSASATEAQGMPGLHNVVTYSPGVVCGGVPEGKEGFATLRAMGIQTILSVDGQKPDVAAAEALGMRYVHLPISYDTVTPERQVQLAQALANLPQPIYVHCHHGKHRSAAALASAEVLCGKLSKTEALARMQVSGTAASYTGLWDAVKKAEPLAPERLHADPASFPSVTVVSGMVATMAEIDMVIDLVKQAEAAGWQAPDDHPDLVATKETARLAKLFAGLQDDRESLQLPADYQQRLQQAITQTSDLDAAVRQGDAARAKELLAAVNKGCKDCHKTYRDQ